MTLLILGILLFAGVHLVPALAPGVKSAWRGKLGEGGYKGSFALLLLASIVLMVTGWKNADPFTIYMPISQLRQPGIALAMIAVGLLVVGSRNSRIRQGVRHPQLTGVLIWSLAHLIMNGDSRSIVLFSGMAIWSFVEIITISKREGRWEKAEVPSIGSEVITAIITIVLVTALVFGHPYIAGIPVIY